MLRIAVASSAVAVALGCFPTCDDDCNRLSPPQLGEVTRLRKLKEKCTSGEEVVFNVDYNPCTHNLDYKVRTPDNCEQRQGNVFTCKNNKRCKVIPFLTELKFCDCPSTEQCTKKCRKGKVCERVVHPCLTPPCPSTEKCVKKRHCTRDAKQCQDGSFVGRDADNNCEFHPCPDPCDGACKFNQDCLLKNVITCPEGMVCPPTVVCVDKPCNRRCPKGDVCELMVAPCLIPPCPVVETCKPLSPPTTPTNPCGSKCGAEEICYMRDTICNTFSCHPVPTCITNHCMFSKCEYGNDCVITDHGDSSTCKPWSEIGCFDKPCKAGYTCVDVKRVCKTAPCYQYECSWEAPVHCTKDAKQCQDGSFVGRDSNNNCEFHPCPDPCDGACKFNQDCLLKNVITCPEGMVCPPTVVCVDKPCNKKCPKGDVCELMVTPCLIPPCPVVETCKTVVQPKCDKKCPKGEECELIDTPCPFPPCSKAEICSPIGCGDDLKDCSDGSSVERDPKNGCQFFPCPVDGECEDEDDCEGWNFCIEGKCVDAFEGTCNSVKDCNGYGCYYNDNKEPTCRTTCMGEPTWLCDKNHLCLGDECVDMKQCKTNCGNLVPHLFKGNDDGDNSCNECTCFNGDYSCTERGCTGDETCGGPSPPTTPTNPCGSKCGAEEICYMRDTICNTFSCHPVPTCITNHCMFSKCGYGNDCVITDHGDSSTCKPWSEIGCFDKPCKAGYTCVDVKRVCKTAPCYQYECSWEAPVHCTKDAKQCQDGSFVGRDSNNNCEFHPCPDPCDGACKFNQDCLLKNVITCPEGMVCPPTVVCVDKPCNKKCPAGDVCEHMVAPCLIPPCPVIETCKPLSPPTTPTNPCGSKCGAEERCYMRDVICNTFSCHPVPTCITNHCMFSKCGYGNDCVITDHGDSSTCKPWSEIGCFDKPCKAGYTCVDVKRVCKTAPCYQYECSWEAPVHCTADAKQCQDGSFVGRDSNNNCEFHPCPDPCDGACKFNQDCLLKNVITCPEGMVCPPTVICVDKPCNRKCPKGDVCELMVTPCLIPPCPVVETCKTVVQP